MYNRQYPNQLPEDIIGADKNFIIQSKDHGEFWDESVAQDALEYISKVSQEKNVIVILFAHGWHHNAAPDDSNLHDFFGNLETLKQSSQSSLHIVGIYLGWRGRSLPSILDYLTFWGRKFTAEKVGNGALSEFLIRLNRIYRKRNEPQSQHFMGLVSIGHSFGSLVLLSATRDTINYELIRRTSWLKQPMLDTEEDLHGFGDLIVLINPALENTLFTRIQKIYQRLTFKETQLPLMLVISSRNDFARKFWFPIGRFISCLFHRNFIDYKKRITALGFDTKTNTHDAALTSDSSDTVPNNGLLHSFTFANVSFSVKPEYDKQYRPFIVAEVTKEIIPNHNEIFGNTFTNFLLKYITAVETERLKRKQQN